MSNSVEYRDKPLFLLLLILLVALPLPMGANRVWIWPVMEIWVQGLALIWIVLALVGRVAPTESFKSARLPLLLFLAWIAYLLLQHLPLPTEWVRFLSPAVVDTVSGGSHLDSMLPRMILHLDPWAGASFVAKSWTYFLLFSLVLLLVRTRERIRLAVAVLVLSGVFQALFGAFMVLSGTEWLLFEKKEAFVGNATGTFVNRNHLAGYLNMCLALGIGWLVSSAHDGLHVHWKQVVRSFLKFAMSEKMRLRIYLVFMAIALVMTHSRMGNVAFLGSLVATAAVWLLLRRRRPKTASLLVLASVLVIDIAVLGNWFGIDKVVDRLQHTSMQTETRDDVVRDGRRYIEDFWPTGSGGGSFYSVYPRYMGEGTRSYYRYAHNDYLQFFVETGIVGTALLFALVTISLFRAVKAMARRRRAALRGIAFGSFMGILSILIHSTVDFNLQIPSNAATFVVLLAFAHIARACRCRDTNELTDLR